MMFRICSQTERAHFTTQLATGVKPQDRSMAIRWFNAIGPGSHLVGCRLGDLRFARATGVGMQHTLLRGNADMSLRNVAPSCLRSVGSPKATTREMEVAGFDGHEGEGLDDYMEHVVVCNSGIEHAAEFIPFVVDGKGVGFVHPRFAEHLRRFPNVFSVLEDGQMLGKTLLALDSGLLDPEERTQAVARVLQVLRSEGLIPGWRNELLSVVPSFGAPPLLALERAAVPFFGTKAYGVHMNGFVIRNGEKHLWVARRSATKQTFPGMLDHLVAGGQPQGLSCRDNLLKECEEEAGIPESLAIMAAAVGAVSYETISGQIYKRDLLFCYDLELPVDFTPFNKDGEVESFMLLPVREVAKILRTTKSYKPNCALVLIDFLIRHGYITPDQQGYLRLLQGLRSGEWL